jgi:hypothetical protein
LGGKSIFDLRFYQKLGKQDVPLFFPLGIVRPRAIPPWPFGMGGRKKA